MNLTNILSIKLKSNITLITVVLLSSILFSTETSYNFIHSFFVDVTGTISVDKTEVCKDESVTITFEGSEGIAPYTFTYELNDVIQPEITTTSGDRITITLGGSTPGNFTYKLISIKDSSKPDQDINITDQEETIQINAPPTVNFTFNNENSCSGETIQFTNTSTGEGNLSYNWDFGDSKTSSQKEPTHIFEALGCGTETFSVKLTVTDENGCSASITKDIDVQEKPDIDFGDSSGSGFSNCSNSPSPTNPNYQINLLNLSEDKSCIETYEIEWGDGNSLSINAEDFETSLDYEYTQTGVFNLKVKAIASNGCENEKTYQIKNVSTPAGGFEADGNTADLCPSNPALKFGITNFEENSDDSIYIVDYGDGTTPERYSHSEVSAGLNLSHQYTTPSCNQPNNQFIAKLTIENACTSRNWTVDNITVLDESEAKFDAPDKACINKSINFINQSVIGDKIGCDGKLVSFLWDFGDGSTDNNFLTSSLENQSHTYTSPGTYTVTLKLQGKCIGIDKDIFTKEICIEPEITTSFSVDNEEGCIPLAITATNTTDETGLCSNPTYNWTVSYNSGNCGTSEDWEFTNGTDATSENPMFLFKNSGKYTITQRITTGCGTETSTKVIDVKKPPTVTINPILDFCGTATLNPTATVENCTSDTTGITYNWTFTGGNPASANTLNPGDVIYNTPGVYEVTLEVTSECGVSNTATQTFEVFEKPILTNTDTTHEICSGQNTTEIILTTDNVNTTYSWSAVSSGNISGFSTNGTTSTIPSQVLINSGNNPETITYTVIPKLGNCEGDAFDFIITVNPSPIITTQPISSEVCLGGTATTLEVAYTNGTGSPSYQWYSNTQDSNSGGTEVTGATSATYEPPANAVGTTYYYVEISFSSGGCSQIVSNTAKVDVNPQITINPVPGIQTICIGGTADEFEVTFTGGTGSPSYQWYANTTNSNSGGNLINGATSSTYTPPVFTTVGDFFYYAEVSLDGNGCTITNSDVFEVQILADPIIDTQPIASQELCANAIPTDLTVAVSGGTTSAKNYQWFVNTNNNTTSGNAISGANAATFSPETSTIGTFYYYVVVSQPESDCTVISDISALTVNPSPIITTQPISSEVCVDGTATTLEVAYTNGTGTPSYQWYSNTINSSTGGDAITGATNSDYQPLTNAIGETFYYAEISFTSGGCDKIVSSVASVNIVEQLNIDPVTPTQTICVGGTADEFEVTFSGGTGNPTYQWYANTTNSNSGGNLINGATSSTYSPPVFTTVGDFFFYAEVSLDGNGCTIANSDVFEVQVLADPIIDTQPIASQELCANAIPTDLTVAVSGGTTSAKNYQWFINTNNNTTSGNAISGANAPTYSPETSTIGTFYYYVVVSQPESDCTVVSDVAALTINEAPIFTTQPTSSEICLNGTATTLEVAYTNGTGTPSYQWFSNTIDDKTSGTAIVGATSTTYQPPANAVGTTYYYVEISFSSGGCSQIVSNTAKVDVNPQITINPVPGIQTLCIGGTADEFEVTFSGGTGNPTYQWYANSVNANSGGNLINGATSSTYTPATFTTVGDFFFYAEVSLDGNGCTIANSDVFEVQVLADPIIDTQPIASQELCANATPTDLTVAVSGGTTSAKNYQWFVNTNNNTTSGNAISGANAPTFSPETSTIGTFYYYVVVSQPESDCTVISDISALTVNPSPIITTQPISSEVCLNGTTNKLEVVYTNGTGTPSYQWFSNTINDKTTGTAIAGATSDTYDPPTNSVGTTYYYAEISFSSGGCSKITSDTARVKINGIPVISNASITIYSEATFTFEPSDIPSNTVPTGTQYTWSAPTFNPVGSILGASAEINPQNTISQTLENVGTSPIVVTYNITPATPTCTGTPFTLEVTVNPNISSNAMVTNITCFEVNDGVISTTIEGGIPFSSGNPYLIFWTGPNGFSSTNATITNLAAGTYTLRLEDSTGFFITEEWIVTQPDLLTITKEKEQNISCFQGNDGIIEVRISGGTNPYTFNWTTTNGSGIIAGVKNQNTLTAGIYILEVIDQNNCVTSTSFTLTEPEGLAITTTDKQNVLCFGEATGSISLNVTGGTKSEVSPGVFDYIYNWSGPNGFTSSSKNINNLIAGVYTVAVTDNLGCTTSSDITINESPEIIINYTKTDVSCYGATDGALEVTVEGGAAPYQISWSNFGNGFTQYNLEAGTYVATITDANNCVEQVSIEINQPLFFIDPDLTPISCNGANDGSIRLNLTGGIAPIRVTWDDDPSAGVQRNNLSAGTYKVTIIDSDPNQCPIEETFVFTNPPAIAVSSTVTDAIDCTIENSGFIDLTVTGGTAPYSFNWSNGATTEDLQNISKGDYTVTITDTNGCSVSRQFSIFRQDPIEIEFTETLVTNCVTKTISKQIEANVLGGFSPHTLSWSSGTVSGVNNQIMTTDQNGSYQLTVTDDKGCIQTKSVLINDIPTIGDLDFRYRAFALNSYDLLSIEDPIQFTNLSTGDISLISWDFGDGSPLVKEENPVHTYDTVGNYTITLTITYESGCTYTMQRSIDITIGYQLIHPTGFTPNGDGFNETIRPKFTGFTELEMNIYDSWGTKVYFEKGTTLNGWDGTIKGKPAENGNYIMVVIGTTFYNKTIKKTTTLTLLK